MVSGPGIKENFIISEANNTVVPQPLCWTGEVPYAIFK